MAGKVQRKAGELVASREQEAKGAAKEATGNVQKRVGNAKQELKDSARKSWSAAAHAHALCRWCGLTS